MDSLKLLIRSTNLKVAPRNEDRTGRRPPHIPSEGPVKANPQRCGGGGDDDDQARNCGAVGLAGAKKRKRGRDAEGGHVPVFSDKSTHERGSAPLEAGRVTALNDGHEEDATLAAAGSAVFESWSLEQRKRVLAHHKIKITNLSARADADTPAVKKKSKKSKVEIPPTSKKKNKEAARLYPQPITSFKQLRSVVGISKTLARNIEEQGYDVPTEVQLSSLPLLLGGLNDGATDGETHPMQEIDLLTIAPTGSGKTLAFLIPLIYKLQNQRREGHHVKAVILAPTKELVGQIVSEGRRLSAKTGVRISVMRKGMVLDAVGQQRRDPAEDEEYSHDELSVGDDEHDSKQAIVKSDILVSTPLALSNSIGNNQLPDIQHLILDEADVLLDPLFRDQTMSVWNACSNQSLRTTFWSATMGASIEDLVKTTLVDRQAKVSSSAGSSAVPLIRLIVGLKDASLPNITHKLIYAATEPGKLLGLRSLLRPSSNQNRDHTQPILRPPFLIFTQTIPRAKALHHELRYDIPLPSGGSSRIAVLHSQLPDPVRHDIMTRFRQGKVWILITTDLLSRGIDFRGVNGVVNYDIPGSAAGYVHRAGRTGRQGREGGVVVTFYTKEDIPYVRGIANVIAASEKQRGDGKTRMLGGDGLEDAQLIAGQPEPKARPSIPSWLIPSLPTVSKKSRQLLKRRGVESRRALFPSIDDDADDDREKEEKQTIRRKAAKSRISTKPAFDRRTERRRRDARERDRNKHHDRGSDEDGVDEDGGDWDGFD